MRYGQLNKLSGPVWYFLTLGAYAVAFYVLGNASGIFLSADQASVGQSAGGRGLILVLILLPLSTGLAVTWYQRHHTNCNVYEWEYWQKLIWAQRFMAISFLIAGLAIYIRIRFS